MMVLNASAMCGTVYECVSACTASTVLIHPSPGWAPCSERQENVLWLWKHRCASRGNFVPFMSFYHRDMLYRYGCVNWSLCDSFWTPFLGSSAREFWGYQNSTPILQQRLLWTVQQLRLGVWPGNFVVYDKLPIAPPPLPCWYTQFKNSVCSFRWYRVTLSHLGMSKTWETFWH